MCYDIEEGHRRLIKDAIHVDAPADQINELIDEYNNLYNPLFPLKRVRERDEQKSCTQEGEVSSEKPRLPEVPETDVGAGNEDSKKYHVSGFEHPDYEVIYSSNGRIDVETMKWGLIPRWCKNLDHARKIWNGTINARSESMFEKPSFRLPAREGRGIIVVHSFFEHHHHKGRTYPFNIRRRDGRVLALGVIWDEWTDKDSGEILKTFSITTVSGNSLLAMIHNSPKLNEPRMPLILEGEALKKWLDLSTEKDELLQKICVPFPAEKLKAFSVGKLRGKAAVGPGPEAIDKVDYNDLDLNFED